MRGPGQYKSMATGSQKSRHTVANIDHFNSLRLAHHCSAPEACVLRVVGSRRHQQDLVRSLDGLETRPVVDRSSPLDAIAEAFALQRAGGHFGKIVLEP